MNMNGKYNYLIAFLQVYGIILVVMGHVNMSWAIDNPLYIFREWIYSFHMPLFVFISGYLLLYTVRKESVNFFSLALQKAKRLLLPYIFISSLVFLPKMLLNSYAVRPVELSWSAWVHMLVYPWDNVIQYFWFIPTLYLVTLLTVLALGMLKRLRGLLLYVVLGVFLLLNIFNPLKSVLFLNLSGVVNYLFYFALGIYYCFYQYKINKVLFVQSRNIMLLSFVISIFFLFCKVNNQLLQNLIAVVFAVNGIIMSLSLGHIYIVKKYHFLHHLFGSSSAIYFYSWFPLVASQQIIAKIYPLPWEVITIIALITGIYVPLLLYKFLCYVKKNFRYGKYVTILLGQ